MLEGFDQSLGKSDEDGWRDDFEGVVACEKRALEGQNIRSSGDIIDNCSCCAFFVLGNPKSAVGEIEKVGHLRNKER